jgi:diguanylate cyclase (GGDEF)-like protein
MMRQRTAPPEPASERATLAEVAGRLVPLLGSVTIPIYVAGAVVTHGVGRWALLGMTLVLSSSVFIPTRRPKRSEAPGTVTICVAAVVMWIRLVPHQPVLLTAVLAVSMVYMGLMVPRPFAQIGIGAAAVAYVGSEFAFGTAGGQAWQVFGVAATDAGMGGLMLGIRITTERKVNERTAALAAANEKLEQLSRTDALTGLANRRRLDDALAETWRRAGIAGRPISVIMIDIDYFKQYNDHFGHLGGDGCLQKLAAVLTAGARESDIVARYGGEEFAVVLPDTDFADAWNVAERLRRTVAGLEQEHPGSPTGYLTVSVGVASAFFSVGETGRRDLLQRADEGLYLAKHNGRNRVAARGEPEVTQSSAVGT